VPAAAGAPAGGSGGGSGLTKKVGGIPIWALGAGGLVVLLLLIIVGITVLGGDETADPPDPPPSSENDDDPDDTTTTTDEVESSSVSLPQSTLDDLEDECAADEFSLSCDFLFFESPPGSDQEEFGSSCGGTFTGANGTCGSTLDSGSTIDGLVQDCDSGDNAACDELFLITPVGSQLELFGTTCGGRSDEELAGSCEAELG
jgi:hypothetical protein